MLNDTSSATLMLPAPGAVLGFRRKLDLREILLLVEAATGISVRDLVTPSRFKHICRARHIFYYAARRVPGRSYKTIGDACGGKDHQTVWHGVHKVQFLREDFEPELSRVLAGVDHLLAQYGIEGRTP